MTKQDVQNEYTRQCAQLGHLLHTKTVTDKQYYDKMEEVKRLSDQFNAMKDEPVAAVKEEAAHE